MSPRSAFWSLFPMFSKSQTRLIQRSPEQDSIRNAHDPCSSLSSLSDGWLRPKGLLSPSRQSTCIQYHQSLALWNTEIYYSSTSFFLKSRFGEVQKSKFVWHSNFGLFGGDFPQLVFVSFLFQTELKRGCDLTRQCCVSRSLETIAVISPHGFSV